MNTQELLGKLAKLGGVVTSVENDEVVVRLPHTVTSEERIALNGDQENRFMRFRMAAEPFRIWVKQEFAANEFMEKCKGATLFNLLGVDILATPDVPGWEQREEERKAEQARQRAQAEEERKVSLQKQAEARERIAKLNEESRTRKEQQQERHLDNIRSFARQNPQVPFEKYFDAYAAQLAEVYGVHELEAATAYDQARREEVNRRTDITPVHYAVTTGDLQEKLKEEKLLRGDDELLGTLQSRYLSMSPERRKRFANELYRIMHSEEWQKVFSLDVALEKWEKENQQKQNTEVNVAFGRAVWHSLQHGKTPEEAYVAAHKVAIKKKQTQYNNIVALDELRRPLALPEIPETRQLTVGTIKPPKKGRKTRAAKAGK